MPRSALVIGVGGTGSWILSWLKKDLLETPGNLADKPVRLLLLDTAGIIAEAGGPTSGNGQNGTNSQGGGGYSRYIVLDRDNEFIQLPTKKDASLTRQINAAVISKNENVDHISSWFAGGYFPDASLSLVDGASQFRQLGRLSLMQGLHLDHHNDKVYTTLQGLVTQILDRAEPGSQNQLDVHIAGSLIGGSGSGLFLDLAWLVRKIVPAHVQVFITGFFVLPSAFTRQPTRAQRMKAFAAWRELNRMMTVKEGETELRMIWGKDQSVMYDVRKPLYDHVYLLDGALGKDPTETVFPIVAEAISFYLDRFSGATYIQHIRQNLANAKKTNPLRDNPSYSVLYVKSWKLPTYHNIRVARHQFALSYLRQLLKIQEEQEINYAERRQARTVYKLVSDPVYRNRSTEIFNAPMTDTGSTRFLEALAEVARIPANQYQSYVTGYGGDSFNLLNIFADMPETPDGIAIRNKLHETIHFALPVVPETNNHEVLQDFIQTTQDTLYGRNYTGAAYITYYGDFRSDEYKGKLFNDLLAAQDFQMDVFTRRVKSWVQQELNRSRENNNISNLASVLDALSQLEEDLKENIRFFTEVKNNLGSINEAENYANQALQSAVASTAPRSPLGQLVERVTHKAHDTVVGWLQWEDVNLSRRRNHRAVERIIVTLRHILDFVSQVALPNTRAMEAQLVTDNNFDRVNGLYRGLLDSLKDEDDRHAFDQRLKQVTELLTDDGSIPPVDEEKVNALIRNTSWEVDSNLNLTLKIQVSLDPNDPKITLQSNLKDSEQTRRLVNQLVEGVASYVIIENQEEQSAAEVMGVARLIQELPRVANTGYLHSEHTLDPAKTDVRTFYVRAAVQGSDRSQLQTAINNLTISGAPPNAKNLVDSENPAKIMVFSARELLMPKNFEEWWRAEAEYQTQAKGDSTQEIEGDIERVRNDHLFAGERQALTLEHDYLQRERTFPTLDQRLVHLLEHRSRLEDFLRLWALGWLVDERPNDTSFQLYWYLNFPEEFGFDSIVLGEKGKMDMLGLIARYVAYGRDIDNHPLPFKQIGRTLEDELKKRRKDNVGAQELQEIYAFEARLARELAQKIEYQMSFSDDSVINANAIKKVLDDTTARIERSPTYIRNADTNGRPYRRTLAEELAYDFTQMVDGSSLVGNIDAHLQAMKIVLNLLYTFRTQEMQAYRQNSGWL